MLSARAKEKSYRIAKCFQNKVSPSGSRWTSSIPVEIEWGGEELSVCELFKKRIRFLFLRIIFANSDEAKTLKDRFRALKQKYSMFPGGLYSLVGSLKSFMRTPAICTTRKLLLNISDHIEHLPAIFSKNSIGRLVENSTSYQNLAKSVGAHQWFDCMASD
ncbi:hypothetical protein Tco_1328812 [Tanacetum coccineum]